MSPTASILLLSLPSLFSLHFLLPLFFGCKIFLLHEGFSLILQLFSSSRFSTIFLFPLPYTRLLPIVVVFVAS